MPGRPRNHEIETETRRAFEAVVPSSWVIRPVDGDDYGIDREVEVFESNATTGLTFKVQLKGTDGSGDSIRAKRDTVVYWQTLDVPVLVVSYSTRSGMLRGRWAHTIGTDVTESGAEKVTIKMRPAFELTDGWTESLAGDLHVVRELRRGIVPNPLPIAVEVDQGLGLTNERVSAEVLRMSRSGRWPMRPAEQAEEAVRLEIRASQARASLPLLWGSATVHMPTGWTKEYSQQELAQLLLLLTAGAHANLNVGCAREIAMATGPDSTFWMAEELGSRIGPILAAHGDCQFLFDIVSALSRIPSPEATDAIEWFQALLHDCIEKVDEAGFSKFSETRRRRIAVTARSDPKQAGRQLFNLAFMHKGRRDFETAANLFRESSELATRYKTDPLMLRHLGSTLWEIGRYQESADTYRAALEYGFSRQELLPLLADSLMLAGQYEEAADLLTSWEPAGEERDRVGIIRTTILAYLHSTVGVSQQDRTGVDPDEHLAKVLAVLETGEDVADGLLHLLRTEDALSPAIWMARVSPSDLVRSFLPALITATMTEDVTAVWVVALICGLASAAPLELLTAISNQARLFCGDDFYDAVSAAADAQKDESKAEDLRMLLAATYATNPVTHGLTFRYVNLDAPTDWVIHQEWIGKPGAVRPMPDA